MRDARVSWSWSSLTGVGSQLEPNLQSKSIGVQGSGGFPTIKLKQPTKPDTLYHYLLIIDLEATCEEGWRFNFPHEIIAFLHFWLIYAEENVLHFFTHFSDQ